MRKIAKTTAAGGAGFLAGLLLEKGLESLTGLDFVDGLFAVSGSILAALSVNRDLVEAAARNIEQMFGKDPWRSRRASGASSKKRTRKPRSGWRKP